MSDPAVPPVPPFPAANALPPAAGQPGYAPPAGQAPYAAPYTYPGGAARPAETPPPTPVRGSSVPGAIALVAGLVASIGAPLVAAIAGFNIGLGTGREIALRPLDADFDWSVLTPVRDWVLMGEIAFWIGTAIGIWALVQGIVAIVTNRGRVQGIVGTGLAVLGPIAFAIAVQASIAMGFAAGSSIGG